MGITEVFKKTIENQRGYKYNRYSTKWSNGDAYLYHYGTGIFGWDTNLNVPILWNPVSTSDSCAISKVLYATGAGYLYEIKKGFLNYLGEIPLFVNKTVRLAVKGTLSLYRWSQVMKFFDRMARPYVGGDSPKVLWWFSSRMKNRKLDDTTVSFAQRFREIEDSIESTYHRRENHWLFGSEADVKSNKEEFLAQLMDIKHNRFATCQMMWIITNPRIPYTFIKATLFKNGRYAYNPDYTSDRYILDFTLVNVKIDNDSKLTIFGR